MFIKPIKVPLIILVIFLFTSFVVKAQVLSLNVNGRKLTVLDSTEWEQQFHNITTAEEWRNNVLDSIDVDNEKIKTVRITKSNNESIMTTVEIYYIVATFSSNRVYKQELLNFNIKDSTHILDNNIPFDMLLFDLQYGKKRFYSAVKLYSGVFQNKLQQETFYSFKQSHFFNDIINANPCFEFILDGNVIQKDKGYYLLADTIKVELYLKREEFVRCSQGFSHANSHLINKEKIKSISSFIEGTINAADFYKKHKNQIKVLPENPTQKQLSKQPYFYIFRFLPKKLHKKAVFLEYIMEIGNTEAEIWIYIGLKTINFKINLAKQ